MARRTSDRYRYVCYVLNKEYSYTMKAIAELLHLSPTTVSVAINYISYRVMMSDVPNEKNSFSEVKDELIRTRKYIEEKNMLFRLKMNARRLKLKK